MKEPRQNRRDLLLILLLVPLGMLCMFITGQMAIQLKPIWQLEADLRSFLNPTANFLVNGEGLFEPVNTDIPPAQHRPDFLLTPSAIIPTSVFIVIPTPIIEEDTPVPTIGIVTPVLTPPPTPTIGGPIIVPTSQGRSQADLVITKTDRSNTYTPGNPINYTIVVTNRGPDRAPRFDVNDNVPADITVLTVDCTPAIRCGTNTSSGNNISFTGASLFQQQEGVYQITITISGTVASGASGNLSNTANVAIPSGSRYGDPNTSNNSVTDTDTQLSVYDLAITKSDGVDTYTTTNPLNYTVVVTNNGPSDARGVRVIDNLTQQITSWTWTCVMINASGCNEVTSYRNDFIDNVNIQAGGRIEYTVTANPAGGPAQNLSNTANIDLPTGSTAIDPKLSNNTATDTDAPYIDLQITKTDSGATFSPGSTIDYVVTVTNNSSFDLTNISISDLKPTQITSWDWTCATANPSCSGVINSNTDFTDAIDLTAAGTAGASLTYNVSATVSGTVGLVDITNIAKVGVDPLSGLVDADPTNDSATETTPPDIDLEITKDDGVATYTQGGSLQYIVTVTNHSAFDLTGVTVNDNMPSLISSWSWTCGPNPSSPSATCDIASGTGSIVNNTVNLPANGGSVIYTINATVSGTATGNLTNTASVSGYTDAVPGNNTAEDTDSRLIEYVLGPPDGNIISPPSGTSVDYTLTTPITIDGNTSDYEIVFYERGLGNNTIDLDQVIISISNDGTNWYVVYYWGDNIPDLNASPPGQTSEPDNYSIPMSLLYGSPYQTGILIDADGGIGAPPNGTYQFIRVTAPAGDAGNDGCDIDTIGVWP